MYINQIVILMSLSLFISCSTTKPAAIKNISPAVKVEKTETLNSAAHTASSETTAQPETKAVTKPEPQVETTHHHAHTIPSGTPPEVALGWMKNGNIRFYKHYLRNDGQYLTDVKKLSTTQKPHTVVLACSDSRVPPEILFDQKLGEIFVVRTAGETLDPTSIGSIEYALSHLGTKHVLVLGHTHCGAVKAACATLSGADAGSSNLNALVKDIHPRIESFRNKQASYGYTNEVWANTKGVAEDLIKRSSIISSMTQANQIKINTAVYDIETGKVQF